MQSENRVILVGNLGSDAELRTNLSTPMATFSLATSESWLKDGVRQEKTDWHRVTCWGKTAETLTPFLVKGRAVYVTGKLSYREFEKDGVKRTATEIRADRIILLGHRAQAEADGQAVARPAKPAPVDDDLAF